MCAVQRRKEHVVRYKWVTNWQFADLFSVWTEIVKSMNRVRSIFAGNKAVEDGLQKFVLELVTPAAEGIGWESASKEDNLTTRLRSLLISTAGGAGHQP